MYVGLRLQEASYCTTSVAIVSFWNEYLHRCRAHWLVCDSQRTGKIRTFLRFAVLARVRFYTKLDPETAYRLLVQRTAAEALTDLCRENQAGYTHRNPVALAREWQALLDSGEASSCAALARWLGVSRAHVTQVLSVLRLTLEEQQAILALGDPIKGRQPGIHTLREWVKLTPIRTRRLGPRWRALAGGPG
jgi:hypothetical protein